jgi:hypothetical protein
MTGNKCQTCTTPKGLKPIRTVPSEILLHLYFQDNRAPTIHNTVDPSAKASLQLPCVNVTGEL